MRNLIIGVAAAVLAIAVPSIASADTRATVGAHYNNYSPDAGDDLTQWGLDGAFNHDFSNGWSIQGDGSHDNTDTGAGTNLGTSYGAINLGMRSDAHSIYGFVGMSDLISSGTQVGVGGQLYFSNITLDGSVGYANFDGGINVTNVSVGGTWFVNDNFGVSANVAHTELDQSGPGDQDYNAYGISAEYRFADSPFSIAGGFRHSDPDAGDVDTWSVSLTMDLGTGSLHERSTQGPSWNGAHSLYQSVFDGIS